jgi:hypothetical protein
MAGWILKRKVLSSGHFINVSKSAFVFVPTPLGHAVGEKGINMSKNKETKIRKSGFNPNRACYLSSDGKYYCYEYWDDDAKRMVTQ